eukprot:GFUD01028588.1.p1 GENE.GFUD01028588.1~~GFUD01028588.1.p1  ORF type:complete len:194 (+),score=50.61 GFUD01028588.1:64-645(+)
MTGVFLLLCFMANLVTSLMVMDEASCAEVEEEECGICHTIYMKECEMKMEEEMMPVKVSMCKNVTRYESKCHEVMDHKMVEEKRPLCKFEILSKSHIPCSEKHTKLDNVCKRVMTCKLGMKMMKKPDPKTVCEDIAIGIEEKCVDMVKLKKEKHEAKYCSFHPKTVCKQEEGNECRKVKKKMCNYQDLEDLGD